MSKIRNVGRKIRSLEISKNSGNSGEHLAMA